MWSSRLEREDNNEKKQEKSTGNPLQNKPDEKVDCKRSELKRKHNFEG